VKLVIKIGTGIPNKSAELLKLADAVRALLLDGHRVVLIHGSRTAEIGNMVELLDNTLSSTEKKTFSSESFLRDFSSIYIENRCLVAPLMQHGIQVLGICASDACVCRLRKVSANGNGVTVEVVQIDPKWVDIICGNGGVPVISNLGLSGWGEYYLLDSDQMATTFAVNWKADVLIYLTTIVGVQQTTGSIMRLLDLDELESLEQRLVITGDMLLKLR